MELIVFVLLLVTLGILAALFGHDSRDGFPSEEQTLASFGMTWPRPSPDQELAMEISASRMHRIGPNRAQAQSRCGRTQAIASIPAGIEPCR